MRFRKRTLHKLVFEDIPQAGTAPPVETISLADWFMPDAKQLEVPIREAEP